MTWGHDEQELLLYLENDYELVGRPNAQGKAIMANLARKMLKGKYSSASAPKLWQYLADSASQKYKREVGSAGGTGSHAFPAPVRRAVAVELSNQFEAGVKSGEYDLQDLAKRG